MRADRRHQHEDRLPVVLHHWLRQLQLVEPRERELVRHRPPAELRSAILHPVAVVDLVEPVERALGPWVIVARHCRDRAIAIALEGRHHRVARLRHHHDVGVFVAHFHAGQQADVRKPGGAAEGGRGHKAGDDLPVALGNVGRKARTRGGQHARHRRVVVGHGAVRFDEHHEDVRARDTREIRIDGSCRRDGRGARESGDEELCLMRVALGHGRRKRRDRWGVCQDMLPRKHQADGRGHDRQRGTLLRMAQRRGDAPERPSHGTVGNKRDDQYANDQRHQDPRGHGGRHHRDDRTGVTRIPVDIDLASVDRRGRDVGVASHRQQHPDGGQAGEEPCRDRVRAARGQPEQQHAHGQLD